MKPKQLLFTIAFLILPFIFIGQDKKTGTQNSSPFAKGKNEFTLTKNFHFDYQNNYVNDQKTGHSNDLGFNVEWNRFVVNNFAIGARFSAGWSGDHLTSSDNLTRDWSAYVNFTYGKPVTDNFNLYARIGVGYGMNKDITKSPSSTITDKTNEYEFKVGIGAPIRLYPGGNTYITPRITYGYSNNKFDGGKQTNSDINIGLNFESYLDCIEMICDCHHSFSLSRNMYQQGHSYIGYYSKGMFDLGSSRLTYDNISGNNESNNTDGHIKFGYSYYVANNFAIGSRVGFSTQSQKDKNTDNKSTRTRFDFNPTLTFNLPTTGGWNNAFLQTYGGVGSETDKTTTGTNTITTKYSTSNYGFGIGYNDFFANRLSFTPIIGYEWNSSKNKDTNVKNKNHGLYLQMGVQMHF
ncbi:MAG TPA: outer membrane beta-barrel protein [Chitinophagaceae bacterium]|nr:outer membrane beta-barrel protein [Chitinophagaceae bacterium]